MGLGLYRDVEEENGEDRIFQGVNRLVKIPSVIFGLVVPARSKENYMPLSMLDRQMNKLEMGKTILEESNGLPISALREILDFVCFIKSKRMDEGRMELADNVKRELRN